MTLRPHYLPMSICFATSHERFMVTAPLRVPSYVFVADGSQKHGKARTTPSAHLWTFLFPRRRFMKCRDEQTGKQFGIATGRFSLSTIDPERVYVDTSRPHTTWMKTTINRVDFLETIVPWEQGWMVTESYFSRRIARWMIGQP